MRYELKTLFGNTTRDAKALIPVWTFEPMKMSDVADEDDIEEDDKIWLLHNFVRGQAFRTLYGGHLPPTFPVIASFKNGRATSIKSLDWTAPTYADQQAILRKVERHLADLSQFELSDVPAHLSDQIPAGSSIQSRRLLLIVPRNRPDSIPDSCINDIQRSAADLGVELIVHYYGVSTRYENPDNVQSEEWGFD